MDKSISARRFIGVSPLCRPLRRRVGHDDRSGLLRQCSQGRTETCNSVALPASNGVVLWRRCDRRIAPTTTLSPPDKAALCDLARGGAQLLAFRLEHVVQAVLGELDAGREPEAADLLHVMDDPAQREGAARPSDDVGMHRERDVFRALRTALRIELVEIGLPGLEPVIRITVLAVTVAEQRAVAERLPRQLDDDLSVL